MKVLVVRLSAIGDCTLVLPAVRALLEHQPEAEVTWLIGTAAYDLLKYCQHPRLKFVPIEKPARLKDYREIKAKLAPSYDVLLAMQANTRANLIYPWIKAKRKIGFDRTRARELQWLFTNESIGFSNEHLHDSFFQFVQKLGVPSDAVKDWLITLDNIDGNVSLPKKYIVINPAASKLERSWFAENYADVIDYCYGQYGLTTVITGAKTGFEQDLNEKVVSLASSEVIDLTGKTDLQQLAHVIRGAEFCIAPDTGPTHIANAMGVPVIGLYAIAPSRLSGPYCYSEYTIDCFEQAVTQYLNKSPKDIPWRTRVHNRDAMGLIKTNDVINIINRLMKPSANHSEH